MKKQTHQSSQVTKTDGAKQASFLSSFLTGMKFLDGWKNIMSGLNSRKDSRTYSEVKWERMTENDVENLYAGDAIAAKIVDLIVDDSFADGYEFKGLPTKGLEKFKEEWKRLKADDNFKLAAKKGRLYGKGFILKVYNDDLRLENEVKPDEVKEIKNLLVFNRYELYSTYEDVMKDMLSPLFGSPVLYTFLGRGALASSDSQHGKIHTSRLLCFDGAWLPDRLYISNQYCHDTVLSKPYNAIRNYATAHESVNAAIKDLSVAVFKIKNLADMMTGPDGDAQITNRLEAVNMAKSIARAVVVDAEGEDFDYRTRNLTGAAELVDKAEGRLAAETSIPKTVLFGTSPTGGLGQSGNHESENWYSVCEAYQLVALKPNMITLAKEICAYLKIDSSKLDIEFNPLWTMSDKEVTEMRNKQAATDQIYLQEGVIDPSEVRESRFGGDKYSIETTLDKGIDTDDLKKEPIIDPNFSNPLRPGQAPQKPEPKKGEE